MLKVRIGKRLLRVQARSRESPLKDGLQHEVLQECLSLITHLKRKIIPEIKWLV